MKKKENEVPAVGATAFWITGMRKEETQRGKSAVFSDPYAETLLVGGEAHFAEFRRCSGAVGYVVMWLINFVVYPVLAFWADLRDLRPLRAVGTILSNTARSFLLSPYHYTYIEHVRRTKFMDDVVADAVGHRQCSQVVAVGAGLDTRAWRLPLKSSTLFIEIDHPSIFAHKDPIMKKHVPACQRVPLGLPYDEVGKWDSHVVKDAGFDVSAPTVFVLEGLTMYLVDDQQDALFAAIARTAAPGSVVVGDTYVFPGAKGPKNIKGLTLNSLKNSRLVHLFEKNGFTVEQLVASTSDTIAFGTRKLPTWENYPDLPCQRFFFRATKI